MRKCCLFLLVICVMLSAPAYSQDNSKGNLFFSTGFYNGFFADRSLPLLPNILIDRLTFLKLGGYWEKFVGDTPLGRGFAGFGLETGYSSGTRFGGRGGMDFIPLILSGTYSFRPVEVFSFGPSLKLGAFGVNGPDWFRIMPVIGGRLETEFRYPPFPVSLYATGGADIFPMAEELSVLPMVEVGVRFRRPTPKQSNAVYTVNEDKGVSGQQSAPGAAQIQPSTSSSQTPVAPGALAQGSPGTLPTGTPQTQTPGSQQILYFWPDTATLIEDYRPVLEAVGSRLKANPGQQVILQAYTDRLDTAEGRYMVSESRVKFCEDYLIRQYGIAPERITSILYDSEKAPEYITANWEANRCVEVVIHQAQYP